jgi:hypothetical protein
MRATCCIVVQVYVAETLADIMNLHFLHTYAYTTYIAFFSAACALIV